MKLSFTSIATLLALSVSFVDGACLSKAKANAIVSRYAAIQNHAASDLGGPKKTARQLIAPGYQETSDSLNELIGLPVRQRLSDNCFIVVANSRHSLERQPGQPSANIFTTSLQQPQFSLTLSRLWYPVAITSHGTGKPSTLGRHQSRVSISLRSTPISRFKLHG